MPAEACVVGLTGNAVPEVDVVGSCSHRDPLAITKTSKTILTIRPRALVKAFRAVVTTSNMLTARLERTFTKLTRARQT